MHSGVHYKSGSCVIREALPEDAEGVVEGVSVSGESTQSQNCLQAHHGLDISLAMRPPVHVTFDSVEAQHVLLRLGVAEGTVLVGVSGGRLVEAKCATS